MATKPATVFTFAATTRGDGTLVSPAGVPTNWEQYGVGTDGAGAPLASDLTLSQEDINATFGAIADWIVYLDGLSINQVATGIPALFLAATDAGEETVLLSPAGVNPTRLGANVIEGDDAMRVGGASSGVEWQSGVDGGIVAPGESILQLREYKASSGVRIDDEAGLACSNVQVSRLANSASAAELAAAPMARTLYVENLAKAIVEVQLTETGMTIKAGTDRYNVDGAIVNVGVNQYGIQLTNTAVNALGHVQVTTEFDDDTTMSLIGPFKAGATWDAINQRVVLNPRLRTHQDLYTEFSAGSPVIGVVAANQLTSPSWSITMRIVVY